ncbi:MAG: 2-C-methyl-D-erythritol 4-phosphate cytidylyltransferase [Planctomycetota bacterium]
MSRELSVLVLANGAGLANEDIPIALVDEAGRPRLANALDRLVDGIRCDALVVVAPPGLTSALKGPDFQAHRARLTLVEETGDRMETIEAGLDALGDREGVVLIHDLTRTLVPRESIRRVIAAAREHGAAIPGWRIPGVLKEVEGDFVRTTVPGESLRLIGSPGGFRVDLLREALAVGATIDESFPDESALFEILGFAVRLVPVRG